MPIVTKTKKRVEFRIYGEVNPRLIKPLNTSRLQDRLYRLTPDDLNFRVWLQTPGGIKYVGEKPNGIWLRGYHSAPAVRLDENRAWVAWFVVDVETERIPYISESFAELPFFIAHSGRGWHIHIPVFDVLTMEQIDRAKRAIARRVPKKWEWDSGALSPFHPIRNFGTTNPKTGASKQIVYVHAAALLDVDELIADVPPAVKPKPTGEVTIAPSLYEALVNGVEEGGWVGTIHGRNNAAYLLAAAFSQMDDPELAAGILWYWNEHRNNPPLPEDELRTAARAVFNRVKSVKYLTEEEYENAISRFAPSGIGRGGSLSSDADSENEVERVGDNEDRPGDGHEPEGGLDCAEQPGSSDQREGEGREMVQPVRGHCDPDEIRSEREERGVDRRGGGLVRVRNREKSVRSETPPSGARLHDTDAGDAAVAGQGGGVQSQEDENEINRGEVMSAVYSVRRIFPDGSELIVTKSDGTEERVPALAALVSPRTYRYADYTVKLKGGHAIFLHLFRSLPHRFEEDEYFISDPITVYLIGKSIKIGRPVRVNADRRFSDLRTMAFDIEVINTGKFPSAEREADRIVVISLAYRDGDRVWSEVLIDENDEAGLIRKFFDRIESFAPDVLVGHNIFEFDLPYVEARARRYGLQMFGGRMYTVQRRKKRLAERSMYVPVWRVHGMDVIDTYVLAQMWDVYARKLEGYGLKSIAKQLGLAVEEREMIDRTDILAALRNRRDALITYARQDAEEALAVFEALAPPYFELTKYVPVDFIGAVMSGSGQMFDLMLVAEYLSARHGLPERLPYRKQEWGGYTDAFVRGVARDVHHVDVASLYPSIMLRWKVEPENDVLGVFQGRLSELTEMRLELKRKAKAAEDPAERSMYDAQSNAMKILINSAYGMLGFAGAYFRDVDKADFVARTGQEILKAMIRYVEEGGGRPVICDTDGLMFAGDRELVDVIQKRLEEDFGGIRIEYEGCYPAVLVHKKKNYVIQRPDGKIVWKGGFFRSRAYEKFKADLIHNVAIALLRGDFDGAERIIDRTAERILNGELTAEEVAITTSVNTEELKNLPHLYAARRDEVEYDIGEKVTYYIREMPDVKLYKLKAYEAAFPISAFAGDYHREYYYKRRFLPTARALRELIEDAKNAVVD